MKIYCNICPSTFTTVQEFEDHWVKKHWVNLGWSGAHPKIVVGDEQK